MILLRIALLGTSLSTNGLVARTIIHGRRIFDFSQDSSLLKNGGPSWDQAV
jgi:hypothetical protein